MLLVAVAGCGGDDNAATTGTTATEAAGTTADTTSKGPAIKVGLVTDIGGLDDRSFNFLANNGARAGGAASSACRDASSSRAPTPTTSRTSPALAKAKYDLVIAVGFLMADALDTVAKQFPDINFAIIDFDQSLDEVETQERPRPALQGAGGGLPRRLPRRPRHQGGGGLAAGDRLGRRAEDPAGRPVHRGLPGRRQEGRPGDHDAERLLAGLRRPGEVQGARARPDRPRGAGHLPGRRPVRPRRAVRREGEERPRDRRRRRPVVPRRARPHERVEEGRRRGLPDGAGGAGRNVHGRHEHRLRRRLGRCRHGQDHAGRPGRPRRAGQPRSRIRSPRGRSRTSRKPSASGTRWGRPPRSSRIAANGGRAAGSRASRHHQALPRHCRERQRRLRPAQGRGARAAGRERGGEVDADERPLRPLPAGRGRDPDQRQACRAGVAEGCDRGRGRHGAPALHADPGDDGRREHRAGDRAGAQRRPPRLRRGREARAGHLDPLRARRRPRARWSATSPWASSSGWRS